jgi:transposase InsO family protein
MAVVALLLAPHLAPASSPAPPAAPHSKRAAALSGWALVANPRITTTRTHGCDPAPDLRSPRLDRRVVELLDAISQRWRVRVSCVRTGHSHYVKDTRRVSNHTVWRAVDLDQVDGRPVSPSNASATALARWLGGLPGCQYTSREFAALAAGSGVTLSLGRTGQCWDNALSESFFASLKGELIDLQAWPTRAMARRAIVEYIAWYNGTRLHSTLGYKTPTEFEEQDKIRKVV